MKKEKGYVTGGRTLVLFNTGTRPHRSKKQDYSRKDKHKKRLTNYEDSCSAF